MKNDVEGTNKKKDFHKPEAEGRIVYFTSLDG
jgi:hypothetical protein